MRFIADAMLGSLSRWLRLLGFDTQYFRDIGDAELLRRARSEKRCILTRDTDFLTKENPAGILLVKTEVLEEQAAEVLRSFNLQLGEVSRCPNCNGTLHVVDDKKSIEGAVPDHVYHSFNRFLMCSDCGNIYWEGSHYKRFMETVERIIRDAQNT